mgnify:FL=1
MGKEKLFEILQTYYKEWQFKHPQPNDLRRTAERISGLQLQWYLTDWTQTTNKINYAIKGVEDSGSGTVVTLERKELMPMPQEVLVVYKDGSAELHYIPISLMRGEKENEYLIERIVHKDWVWASPRYDLILDKQKNKIKTIILDPSGLMADIDKNDNFYVDSKEHSN